MLGLKLQPVTLYKSLFLLALCLLPTISSNTVANRNESTKSGNISQEDEFKTLPVGLEQRHSLQEVLVCPPESSSSAVVSNACKRQNETATTQFSSIKQLTSSRQLLVAQLKRALNDEVQERLALGSKQAEPNENATKSSTLRERPTLRIQVTGIHVEKAEFPLSKLLFELTLKLALSEVSKYFELQGQRERRERRKSAQSSDGDRFFGASKRRLPKLKLLLNVRSANTCSRQYAAAIAAEAYHLKRTRLFIVSGCDDAIRDVSRLASKWRVPVMTSAGIGTDLDDKRIHKTLVRIAFSLRAAVEFLFQILRLFKWRRVNLIVDESDANSLALKESIERHLVAASRQNGAQLVGSEQFNQVGARNASNLKKGNSSSKAASANHTVSLNTISFDLQSLTAVTVNHSINGGGFETMLAQQTTSLDEKSAKPLSIENRDWRQQRLVDSATIATDDSDEDRWPNAASEKAVREALWQGSIYSRVSILLIPQKYLRKFMLSVFDQNMANGRYTFISIPLLASKSGNEEGAFAAAAAAAATPTGFAKRTNNAPLAASGTGVASYATATSTTGEDAFLWRSVRARARNLNAKQAFESLMLIYLRTPTTKAYVYFASNLNELANSHFAPAASAEVINNGLAAPSGESENVTINFATSGRQRIKLHVNPYLASFYDALQIYARALAESWLQLEHSKTEASRLLTAVSSTASNLSYPAGVFAKRPSQPSTANLLHARISELLRNKRFDNMVTGNININSNGDRDTDYTLDDMNQMTGLFQPVILYRGETCDIERVGRIHWSSDLSAGPTSETVDCSLIGTCTSGPINKRLTALLLLISATLASMGSLFYFVNSRLTLESRLVDYWWRIRLSDLEVIPTRRKNANDGSLLQSNSGAPTESITSSKRKFADSKLHDSANSDTSILRKADAAAAASSCNNKTGVTRATDTSGWNSSAADVCYGNITLASYKLLKVALKPISKFHQSRKLLMELRGIKDINHANLCRFVGILVDEGSLAIVSEFCPKGSLREFFHNESMVIGWTFKYSIINDILAGLMYLNSSSLGFHGRLKSSNCLVSARFVVKLSDYGPHSLLEQVDGLESVASACYNRTDGQIGAAVTKAELEREWVRKHICIAPEHMKPVGVAASVAAAVAPASLSAASLMLPGSVGAASTRSSSNGSMLGDVYSFGLLLYEIITNCEPFFERKASGVKENVSFEMQPKILYNKLRAHGPNEEVGPDLSSIEEIINQQQEALEIGKPVGVGEAPHSSDAAGSISATPSTSNIGPLVELMKACWRFDPAKRPTLLEVNAVLKKLTRGVTSKKLLENLTSRMEQYANNLESLVEAKLATLMEEKFKCEQLLYEFVPRSIASMLREGSFVEPEAFDCVTVFYSDIVGFTSLSSESSPMEVVDLLSDLYLCFDEILEQRDIFKVDTIGDAYIVASGLPQANDGKHVIEIAQTAIDLRERLKQFKIPHKPERNLEMRVGIHSGPCVAGIVGGLNMPKYCVFGDTLTTGKFMESSGMPMKIHITEASKLLLAKVGQLFHIEPRVPRIMRDGLPFQTYWLERAVCKPGAEV